MGFFSTLESQLSPKKILLTLFLAGFLVYGNSILNGFVWDDEEQVVKNLIIQDFGNISQIFSGATFQTGGAGLSGYFFRPLITFTFMLNYFFWGENAFGFHLFQIIFHILNGYLIYRIIYVLMEGTKTGNRKITGFLLALIFIVHPAINEGVVYIAAVSEVMFTFFILMAFNLLLKYQNSKPTVKNIISVCSLLFTATLFKEPAVIGAPILMTFALIYKIKSSIRWLIAFTITLVSYFFLRLIIVRTPLQHPLYSNISEAPLTQRLLTIPAEIFHYLSIIFYPEYLSISRHFVVTEPTIANFFLPLGIILAIFFVSLYAGLLSENKLIFFALAWIIISFGPILNIIPLDMTIAERWLYFPLIGFLLLAAGFLKEIRSLKLIHLITIFLLLSLIPLSIRTIIRNQDWKDGLTLYTHDARINQNSFDLENNLGVELFRAGRIPEAKEHFQKSVSIQPKWHFALNNLGAVFQNEKNYPKAKELFAKVLESSDYYLAHENLSSVYLAEEEYQQARDVTDTSLKKLPNNSVLWLNLAIAEYKLGNKEKALEAAKNAYQLNPNPQTGYVYSQLSQGKELKFE